MILFHNLAICHALDRIHYDTFLKSVIITRVILQMEIQGFCLYLRVNPIMEFNEDPCTGA